jgi:hypothetical protein
MGGGKKQATGQRRHAVNTVNTEAAGDWPLQQQQQTAAQTAHKPLQTASHY